MRLNKKQLEVCKKCDKFQDMIQPPSCVLAGKEYYDDKQLEIANAGDDWDGKTKKRSSAVGSKYFEIPKGCPFVLELTVNKRAKG